MSIGPVDRIISALAKGGYDPRPSGPSQFESRCPSHNGSRHNLSIALGDDGRALLCCHHADETGTSCSSERIVSALGMTMSELFESTNSHARPSRTRSSPKVHPSLEAAIEAIAWGLRQTKGGKADPTWEFKDRWNYTDGGVLAFTMGKYENSSGEKQYRPFHRVDSGVVVGDPAGLLPLYNLDGLGSTGRIFVHEGEKCVGLAMGLGLIATTSAHGSKSAHKTDWSRLAGREVTIVPDADAPGEGYARLVIAELAKLDPRPIVNVVRLPGLSDGEDIEQWLESAPDGWGPDECKAELERLALEAPLEDLDATFDAHPQEVDDQQDEWPAPKLESIPRAVPFPDIVLPDPVADFVRAQAEAIGCPPDFVALPVLVVAGAAIGRSVSLMLKPGYFVQAALYGMNVGDPSSGKSPAHDSATRPVWELDERLHEEYRREREGYLEAEEAYNRAPKSLKPDRLAKPSLKSVVLDDCTQEAVASHLALNPRGLLVSRDEGSAWTASIGQYKQGKGADRQFWLSALFGKPIRVDRKGNLELEPIRIAHPFVSLIGNLTPEMLGELREGQGRSDGFVERILFAFPDRRPKPYWSESGVDEDITKSWSELLRKLRERPLAVGDDGKTHPHVIKLSPEAKKIWIDWHNGHVDEINSPGFDNREISVEGKLQDFAARLALILHLAHQAVDPTLDGLAPIPPVSKWAVSGAIELWRYFRSHHRRVRWHMYGGVESPSARAVLDWIKRGQRESFSLKELLDDLRWIKDSPNEPEATIRWMEERYLIRRTPDPVRPKGTRGRKPHPIYKVNPDLFSPRNTRNTSNSDSMVQDIR